MVTLLIKRIPDIEPTGACRIYIGKGLCTLVDPDDFKRYAHLRIFAKRSKSCWYAIRKHTIGGKTLYIKLHREITACPRELETHHINFNSLDNRKRNLENLTPTEHARLHAAHRVLTTTAG